MEYFQLEPFLNQNHLEFFENVRSTPASMELFRELAPYIGTIYGIPFHLALLQPNIKN